jgi:hypothetical protein
MAQVLRIASFIAIWYPAAPPVLIYANWVVALAELGRMPRFMLDDPKHVASLTPLVHWISGWSLILGYGAFLASAAILVVASLLPKQPKRRQLLGQLGIAGLGALAAYVWCLVDPGGVVGWYFD